jgi:hypothetical protein
MAPVFGCERWSRSAGTPRRDLLDNPLIAVRITEGEERPVACAFGVGAWYPRLRRDRSAMLHVARANATANELVMGRDNVGDDECCEGRTWGGRRQSRAEPDGIPLRYCT